MENTKNKEISSKEFLALHKIFNDLLLTIKHYDHQWFDYLTVIKTSATCDTNSINLENKIENIKRQMNSILIKISYIINGDMWDKDIFWVNKAGTTRYLKEIDDNHLDNIASVLTRGDGLPQFLTRERIKIILEEAVKRKIRNRYPERNIDALAEMYTKQLNSMLDPYVPDEDYDDEDEDDDDEDELEEVEDDEITF